MARASARRRGSHRYYEVGLEHLAFGAGTADEVTRRTSAVCSEWTESTVRPQEDSDIPGYYAFFVFDPDGLRIEVFCSGPEWSSRIHRSSGT